MPSLIDWEQRFREGKDLVPQVEIINPELAKRGLATFKSFVIPDVKQNSPVAQKYGGRTMGHLGALWFFKIVQATFGTYDPVSGVRGINQILILVPKKNGKTSYSSILMNTLLLLNHRQNDDIIFVAPTKQVAARSFRICAASFRAQPKRFPPSLIRIQDGPKIITDKRDGRNNRLLVVAADADAVVGGTQSVSLIDEIHRFSEKNKAPQVFQQVRGARASKPDGLTIMTTTMPITQPRGIMVKELATYRSVRDGTAQQSLIDSRMPVLYQFPKKERQEQKWLEKEYWPRVNPNYGRSVDQKFIQDQFATAKQLGTQALAEFASKHMNVQVDVRLQDNGWAVAHYWKDAEDSTLTLDSLLERSEKITVGGDLGLLDDFLSFAVIGKQRGTGALLHWGKNWIAQKFVAKSGRKRTQYKVYEDEGSLSIVSDSNRTDGIQEFVELTLKCKNTGLLFPQRSIGLDPCGCKLLPDMLFAAHIPQPMVTGVLPGGNLNGTIRTIEHMVHNRLFKHGGSKMMAWCVGNVRLGWANTNVKIDRQESQKQGKYDPVMAMLHAADRMFDLAGKGGAQGKSFVIDL